MWCLLILQTLSGASSTSIYSVLSRNMAYRNYTVVWLKICTNCHHFLFFVSFTSAKFSTSSEIQKLANLWALYFLYWWLIEFVNQCLQLQLLTWTLQCERWLNPLPLQAFTDDIALLAYKLKTIMLFTIRYGEPLMKEAELKAK